MGIEELADQVAARLGKIDGVVAVSLGGSWARGSADNRSDIDLGIYYRADHRPALRLLRQLAQELDDRHPPDAVTDFGSWGPWINGGGGLVVEGHRVDWVYRDLDLVAQVIGECRGGRAVCYYQPGYPHGFHNYVYMSEVHYARPLYDPTGSISSLQLLTIPFPPRLKRTLIRTYLWEAGFVLDTCRKAADRGDVCYVVGCLYRCIACLVQVLFALNERYFLNEKGSVQAVGTFALCPAGFEQVATGMLARPGNTPDQLRASIDQLADLQVAVRGLSAGALGETPFGR
jgi:predicted nucleotidyltransferase